MKKMNKVLLLGAAMLLAQLGAATVRAEEAGTPPATTSSTFRCDSSDTGKCAFLLYTSECKEGPASNGHPTLLCTHQYMMEFSLKVGESRTIETLPAKFKACQAAPTVTLKFPDCAR